MKAVIYALPSACAGGIQARLNDLLNWKEKTVSCVLPVMMGRISENVTAVALSEIRPKVFLGAHLVITGSISYGFAVMHPPTQSCDFAGTLSYCLSPAPQAVPQAAGFSAGLSPVPQAAAGAASAFLFQPKRLERDILIDLHLFRQTAFPVCNAIVTFCSSEKKYAQMDD